MATLTYIGHSAFYIKTENNGILIDPFISQNPKAKFDENSLITDIFVTHGHGDHLGDAISLSRKTKAQITAVFELANYCARQGAFANGAGIGATAGKFGARRAGLVRGNQTQLRFRRRTRGARCHHRKAREIAAACGFRSESAQCKKNRSARSVPIFLRSSARQNSAVCRPRNSSRIAARERKRRRTDRRLC